MQQAPTLPMTGISLIEHRGCRLAYRVRGDGPPVVLIQGAGVHGDGWRPQVDALTSRYRCLWFDNRGIGQSQPMGAAPSVEQMAEDVEVLMDAEGWKAAHVVGHSIGGLVALHLALTNPARVRSLALLCTFTRGRDATRLSPWIIWAGLRSRIGSRRQRRHAFLRLVMPPGDLTTTDRDALAASLAPLFGHDLADQPPAALKQLRAIRGYDATSRLGDLAGVPVLVVTAAHDRIAPPALGRALATAVPGARYVEIPDAAHGVTIQRAERVSALLFEHLARAD